MRVDIELPTGSKAELTKRLFAHVENSTTDLAPDVLEIDSWDYRDPELARRERLEIFGTYPIVAAHSSELPRRFDFHRTQLPNNEVLLVRQEDESVRAFVNVCRHRGARLVGDDSGTRKQFSCRYHGWGYRPDGSLKVIPAPGTFGGIDKDCRGLVSLPCEERHGLVWVVDNPEAQIDVAEWLGPEMDETLHRYRLADTHCYKTGSFDEPINWKTLTDAFLDAYHIATTHVGSVAQYFYSNIQIYDPVGRHGRAISPRRSIDTILHESPETAPIEEHVTAGYSFMPNMVMLRQPDHFQLLTFLPHPKSAERCRMEIRLLIPEPADTDEQRALWDKNWRILMAVLRDEDMGLNRDLQMAMGNEHAPRTLLIGRNEVVNQRFHAWLDETMRQGSV